MIILKFKNEGNMERTAKEMNCRPTVQPSWNIKKCLWEAFSVAEFLRF